MKKIVFLLIVIVSAIPSMADTFEVYAIYGPPISFDGRYLKDTDRINSNIPLILQPNNVIKVYNLNKSNRTFTIPGDKYKKAECRRLGDWFSQKKNAVSRNDNGTSQLQMMMDSVFYWVDSVAVETLYEKQPNRLFAIDVLDGLNVSHEILLPTADGGRTFLFPKEIIFPDGNIHPLIFNLKVGLRDPETEEISFELIVSNSMLIPVL